LHSSPPHVFYSRPHRLLRICFQPDALPPPLLFLPEIPHDPISSLPCLSPGSVTTRMIQHPVLSCRKSYSFSRAVTEHYATKIYGSPFFVSGSAGLLQIREVPVYSRRYIPLRPPHLRLHCIAPASQNGSLLPSQAHSCRHRRSLLTFSTRSVKTRNHSRIDPRQPMRFYLASTGVRVFHSRGMRRTSKVNSMNLVRLRRY
jgi:hypothetical protein